MNGYKDNVTEVVKSIYRSFPNTIEIKSRGDGIVCLSFSHKVNLLISKEKGTVYYSGIYLDYETKESYELTMKRLFRVKRTLQKLKSEHKI